MAEEYTNLFLSDDEPCILESSYSQGDDQSLIINAAKVSNDSKVLCQLSRSCTEYAANRESYYTEASYGSLPTINVSGNTNQGPKHRRLIYCIHGKSSGCCSITEGEIIERPCGSTSASESYGQQDVPANGHCHRERDENVDRKARKKLIIASILCVIFMIGEVVGGYLSSSLAIATDAAHLLTDFASFMISLFSLWVASRPPTRRMSFGWYRAEVIGALTSVLMIWVITGVLVYLAIDRIVNEDFEIDSTIMLITSAVGVVVNIVMGLTLHQHGHSHSHHGNESERYPADTSHNTNHQENINVRAAFIHVVGDFIQSLGVLTAALIIFFKPSWLIVDPICTFLFSALVLITTFAILKDTIMVLMEGIPKGIDFAEVMNTFLQIDGVVKVHNLRIWALSLDKTALSAHLAIRPGVSAQTILTQASRRIHARFKLFEMTLQIEEFVENMEECVQCQCPEK